MGPWFLDYFNIVVNTYTWDPSLWLYIITTSIEGNELFEGGWNGGILPRGVMGAKGPIRVNNSVGMVAI
jgi:hypothetical protein